MQYSVIRLSQCSDAERSATVSEDCQMMIGSGPDSDLRLHVSFGLPDECLRIQVEKGLCVAENLTGDPGLIFVNGQQVFGIMQLDDGDALQIGSDQFAVVVDIQEPLANSSESSSLDDANDELVASTTTALPDALPRIVRRSEALQVKNTDAITTRVVNAAVTLHQPADGHQFEKEVLADVCKRQNAFLLANFKAGCIEEPGIRIAGEDLLELFPKTIRSHESLHAVVHPDYDRKQELWRQIKGRDASVWCFPEHDIRSCLLDIKLYAAWFVRPSVLQAALENSCSEFGERILESFRMLAINVDDAEGHWHLFTKPNVELDRSDNNALFVDM